MIDYLHAKIILLHQTAGQKPAVNSAHSVEPAVYFQAYQGYITTKIADSPADQVVLTQVAQLINQIDDKQLSSGEAISAPDS